MLILVLITECKKKSVFKNNGKKAFEKNDKNILLSKKSWLNNFVLEAYVKKLLKPSAYLIIFNYLKLDCIAFNSNSRPFRHRINGTCVLK